MSSELGICILFVEDNEEIREALSSVLEGEAYVVDAVGSAEEGLVRLRGRTYDLVLTDYSLPGETGAWMAARAREEGLLGTTPVMMVTAHPDPKGAEGLRIIRKPLDLDDFLREVAELTAPAREREVERARTALAAGVVATPRGSGVQLVLYISSSSPCSLRAVRNLQRLLRAYDPSQVHLTVLDLLKEPAAAAEEDRIAFTPTLVKRAPGPRAWVVGQLDRTEPVEDLLSLAGVEPRP